MSAKSRSVKSASTSSSSTKSKDSSSSKPAKPTRRKAAELEKEIIQLHDELELTNEKLMTRTENYEQIVKKIVANVNCDLFDVSEETEVLELEIEDVMEMLQTLLTRTYGEEDSIEVRVEELETRVTKQNLDIAMMSKQLLETQYALEDLCKSCDLEENHRIAKEALRKLEEKEFRPLPPVNYVQTPQGSSIVAPATVREITESNKERVDIGPKLQDEEADDSQSLHSDDIWPVKRLPGTTHINDMKPELRYVVVKELSFNRTSGRDWRLFAERVGIPNDVIERLRHMRVQYPMAKILTTWGESHGATVRMLHRHLTSPQLKWSLLGKHIADSYEVD